MKTIKILSTLFLSSLLLLSSCSEDTNIKSEPLDLSNIEISKEGINKVINDLESKTNLKFKGNLLSAKTTSVTKLKNLRSNIDLNNVILLEVMSENGDLLKIYSAPSSTIENEVSVFTEVEGYVTDEIKFNFSYDKNGNTQFTSQIISNETGTAKSWGSCMQGFFSDPSIGTITQVLGVAGGVGCGPCGIVAGFFTGVAALGCLG